MADATTTEKGQQAASIAETGGADLTFGAISDGEFLKRSGTTIIGGTAGGGLTFTAQTSNYTAAAGDYVACGTDTAAFTVTLPSGGSAGDVVEVKDKDGNAATNNVTVNPNGGTIDGVSTNQVYNTAWFSLRFVNDGSDNWLLS